MANLNLNIPESDFTFDSNFDKEEQNETISKTQDDSEIKASGEQNNAEESKNYDGYNDVTITIKDKKTPIVILFGPTSCGKTMTLVRLSRYLKDEGYTVTPDRTFRDSNDANYKDMCDKLPDLINSEDAASGTSDMNFMLVKILKDSNPKCQILEAMGELYFDPKEPNKENPKYLNQITNDCPNRKIWVFMLEPNWENEQYRRNYVDRIQRFSKKIKSKDKVILLMNKIDKAEGLLIRTGIVKYSSLVKEVTDSYPNILDSFKNPIPVSNWFEPYKCKIIPFQTGDYNKTPGGKIKYTPSDSLYSKNLWDTIKQFIRG